MYSQLALSVDELWLRGKNQKQYLKVLIDHIAAIFKSYHKGSYNYSIQSQRLYYKSETGFSKETIEALTFVPGLAYISPCVLLKRSSGEDMENVFEEVLRELSFFETKEMTFRASVVRADKSYSMTSVAFEQEIGHRVISRYPKAKVRLRDPELIIDVRILTKNVSISTKSIRGIGGLPWGTSGKAVTMLSGGFDSPVASFMMAKRGVQQSFVFFHAYPYVGREVLLKIKNLTKILARYQRQTHLYIVPFGEIQNLITEKCREEYRTLFFRRFMIEISNLIAEKMNADAIVTGDCLGQVSSQTMLNMRLMDEASKRIILRPLVGLNKLEILSLAKGIDTHGISIIPHDDACALFAPKSPIITPNFTYWNEWCRENDLGVAMEKALQNTESFSVNLKGEFFKKDEFSCDL